MKNTYSIVNKNIDVTKELQNIIDSLNVNETLLVVSGTYLVTNLFLHSNMTLIFEEGSILISNSNGEYKNIYTRVAGINMNYYAAVLNIIDCKNVTIKGKGLIDGKGEFFYNLYWGSDKLGGIRKEYDKLGIRFLADYDLNRVRNVLIQNSSNINLSDIKSKDSGFWNIHVLYSNNVKVSNVVVECKNLNSPSTDGIDIDSSSNVLIDNCILDTNDDSICVKSGRDSDGLKTNIKSSNIKITNCTINRGFGITIGSEVSGGIEDVLISNITYNNTDCGFRIKSSKSRKGYIKNIIFKDIKMNNVKYPIHINLDWNRNYCNNVIPTNLNIEMKEHYYKLIEKVSDDIKNTIIDNILISNVDTYYSFDYKEGSRAFEIVGFSDSKINNFNIENSKFNCLEFGHIAYANVNFNNVEINVSKTNSKELDEYDNR